MAVTVLTSAAEVLLATDHDPYVRGTLRNPDVSGWTGHGAVAWRATDAEERVGYLMTLGAPPDVAALIADLLGEIPNNTRVTLPRGTPPLLPAWVAVDGTNWEFWWVDQPVAPQPGEDRVGPVTVEEVAALLPVASRRPRHSPTTPGYGAGSASAALTGCSPAQPTRQGRPASATSRASPCTRTRAGRAWARP